ncbi:lysophospholipid acyltransferase family protein [Carboxylicivirga sp. N1E11]|uniref:lysophospholipid acyltransferase family protein n=1 Tax=Carboxylicivirga longa TaxID=3134029 RepID=UPI003D32751A
MQLPNFKFAPFYFLSALPFIILYRMSDILSFLLFRVFKYRRSVVAQNLNNSFKEKNTYSIAKDYYRHICDIMVETVKGLTISPKKITSKISLANPALLDDLHKQGKNVIVYAAHQGNWEWLLVLPLLTRYKVHAIYQPLSNAYFDKLLKTIRSRFGVHCIPSDKAHRYIAQSKNSERPELFVLIGDQCPRVKSTFYWTQFLNQETAFYSGSARLALKFDQTILYSFIEKKKRGKYCINLHPIEETTVEAISESYSKHLEKSIEQSPSTWLWSHRRWKLKRQ